MTRQRVVSVKPPVTGTERAATSAAAQFGPEPEGERRAGDDGVTALVTDVVTAAGGIAGELGWAGQ
jgi:hypothetical protein